MPKNESKEKEDSDFDKDGTVLAKGQSIDGVATGYWEWYRRVEWLCNPVVLTANRPANGRQVATRVGNCIPHWSMLCR